MKRKGSERALLTRKLKELEFLITSGRHLNSTLNFNRLLGLIAKLVKAAVNVEAVSVMILEPDGGHLVVELARGRRDRAVKGVKIPVGQGLSGWVAKTGRPLMLNEVKGDTRFSFEVEKKLGIKIRSVISIPLKSKGKVVGVLEGVNKKGRDPFTGEDLSIFSALGENIAIAIVNARLYQQLKRSELENKLLYRVSVSLGKSLSLDEVLNRIVKSLGALIPFDAAAVFVLDRRQRMIVSLHHVGYGPEAEEKMRLKYDEGLIGWTATHRESIIVGNCLADPRYVMARGATRSEIVTPMMSGGRIIGIFNLESDQLNAYNEADLKLLEAFAAQAAVTIERARLYEENRQRSELERELRLARTVQEFFTPRKSIRAGRYLIAGANHPGLTLSGDYYDFFPLAKGCTAVAIADVAGKGVPASIIMSGFRASLHTAAISVAGAKEIAAAANRILLETVRPQDFVTAFIGVLNPDSGEITYCNAGHNPPLLIDRQGRPRFLEMGGPVLGVFPEAQFLEGRFRLGDGEILFCYTDGLTEATDEEGREFGVDSVVRILQRLMDASPKRICRELYAELKRFTGDGALRDDVTFLVVRKEL